MYSIIKMFVNTKKITFSMLSIALFMPSTGIAKESENLPSWQQNKTKESIVQFVTNVSDSKSELFIPEKQRIAVFDNDGTLWAEQPIYAQLLFAFSRIAELAPKHPKWQIEEPFASLLKGDVKGALTSSKDAAEKIVLATQTGMTVEEFKQIAKNWILTSKHPTTGKPTLKMVYQPMLELITYLRKHKFKVYMVSGGDTQFLQAWSELAYGIPPEQVLGSTVNLEIKSKNGETNVVRQGPINMMNNKQNKVVSIVNKIGQRPIIAVGNSDGDLNMLQYTSETKSTGLSILLHHTDDKREWQYDSKSQIGHLDKALTKAKKQDWVIIDMKNDWKQVFPH